MLDNDKNSERKVASRRDFLKGLGGVAAAGMAVSAVASTSSQAVDMGADTDATKSVYRETQHIRDYYDSL